MILLAEPYPNRPSSNYYDIPHIHWDTTTPKGPVATRQEISTILLGGVNQSQKYACQIILGEMENTYD